MQITIIGAGQVGAALGRGWARTGHAIVYGVLDPADGKHAKVAAAAGDAHIATVGEAVRDADVVVIAVPWDAVPDAIAACGDLAGRLVIDATNPVGMGPSGLELKLGFSTSGAEEVARLAPGAAVFKTMNQIGFAAMAEAHGYPAPPVMFVAGDDGSRKATVCGLVADLGFEARDAGPLDRARLLEPYAMVWIEQAVLHGGPIDAAFGYMRKRQTP